ncbi:MAG TPA: 5-methyltetrahydropteroyltriglutamate--homocysteine S-methyltransferase [Burkholderiaceae bacterium]|nr:5-methyltetrahydropteroyltriglutamate--homocysteine S-methyltransferase [Burkholderiaceae bacterium]
MNRIRTHVLGFPRIGEARELKFALERHWRAETDAATLEEVGRQLRARHWAQQRDAGLDVVTVGDFSFYDPVASLLQTLGCEPRRFGFTGREPELARLFAMARGSDSSDCGCGQASGPIAVAKGAPLAMTKWFDTNYHYLVPEFDAGTTFQLASRRLIDEVTEACALGHSVKAALPGPLTFLWLGKSVDDGFDRLDLLERLLPAYVALLDALVLAGAQWVQLDEPILGLDLPGPWALAFERAYHALRGSRAQIMLATWFSPLEDHLSLACKLPVAALHVDAVRAAHELQAVLDWLPPHRELSIGIVDGRNIWRCDLEPALQRLEAAAARRDGPLWIAPSCSLLHVPYALAADPTLDPQLRGWLAGAVEKLAEVGVLARALREGRDAVRGELEAAAAARADRATSPRVCRPEVQARCAALPEGSDRRTSAFAQRVPLQRQRLKLPTWPTTTIGSFPQTPAIREARARHRRGELSEAGYDEAMKREIAEAVRRQEAIGLDVLVHGEAERNDMVEYFAGLLAGYAITANGWVQSYGSRCVKPPLLYGDIERPAPMTVRWSRHAQSLTARPMKGMLTGPVTLVQWSFVRDDQARAATLLQLALALRDEIADLEAAGLAIVQVDEPALREGLPLRRAGRAAWLREATRSFRIACSGAGDATQIHTHMCYSEFDEILSDIAALDADVLTIESSRSGMSLLGAFREFHYPNDVGPGVYDIHSPRVPSVAAMTHLLELAARAVPAERLWVNPDCGLKTRGWAETEAALANMVEAARGMRERANAGAHDGVTA